MHKFFLIAICAVSSICALENRACAQLQVAAAKAKATLDTVVTGDANSVNANFKNNAIVAINDVLDELPLFDSAPEPVGEPPKCTQVCVTQCVPVYGCLGRFRGYRRIRVVKTVPSVEKKYQEVRSGTIREALREELTLVRQALISTDANQTDEIIELSKDAIGMIRIIQRRNLE